MSEITRRDVLQRLALAMAAAGTIDPLAAQEAHHVARQAAAASGGRYAPEGVVGARVPRRSNGWRS